MQITKKLVFSEGEYKRRLDAIRKQMHKYNFDAVIVCDPRSIRYISGFHTFAYWDPIALLVLPEDDPIHFTLDFEERNVQDQTWCPNWDGYTQWEDPLQKFPNILKQKGLETSRIGIEKLAPYLTVSFYEAVREALVGAEFLDASGIIGRVRFIKSPQELVYIRQAARATIAGMRAAIDACAESSSENDVAAAVYQAMILAGSESPAIPPMLTAGYRTAVPHGIWKGKVLEQGDICFFEISGSVEGYHAPMIRVVVIGDCTEEQKRMAQASIDAVEAALTVIKPGVPFGAVDKVARDVMRKAGMAEYFRVPIGYPVGIGFPPFWGEQPDNPVMLEGEETLLEEGMVFHLIPSIQNYDWADRGGGHFDLSSTIAVTSDGYELLTDFPREVFYK